MGRAHRGRPWSLWHRPPMIGSVENVERPTVFRPEWPVRVVAGVAVLPCAAMLVALLAHTSVSDPWWWLIVAVFSTALTLCARGLRIRLVADGGGVDVVNVFTRRRYAWSDIDRFDVSSWSGYPIVVTMTGARHRISSQRLSPAERFLELPQPDTRSSRRTESSPGTAQSCRLRLIPKRRAGTSAHPRHIQEETVHHHSSRR
jgi:hypothetical protein